MKKLTKDKLVYWVKAWIKDRQEKSPFPHNPKTCPYCKAQEQLKDEGVKEALEWIDWREQDTADRLESCYSKDGIIEGEIPILKTIRKALIHYEQYAKRGI